MKSSHVMSAKSSSAESIFSESAIQAFALPTPEYAGSLEYLPPLYPLHQSPSSSSTFTRLRYESDLESYDPSSRALRSLELYPRATSRVLNQLRCALVQAVAEPSVVRGM